MVFSRRHRPTDWRARLNQNVGYGYDADWQLTAADYTGQADENRAYDALGNPAGATIGPDNCLLADASFDYVYDGEGNLTRKTDRALFARMRSSAGCR